MAKAASTFLQLEVFPEINGFYNLGKHFVDDELKKSTGSITRHTSVDWYRNRDKVTSIFSKNLEQASLSRLRPVLSEEDLSIYKFLDPAIMAARLRAILGEYDVVFLIRNPFSWIKSQYLFRLSTGEPRSVHGFESWSTLHLNRRCIGNDISELWYCSVVDCYAEHCGGDIHIIPHELMKRDPKKFSLLLSKITSAPSLFFEDKLALPPNRMAHKLSINNNQKLLFETIGLYDKYGFDAFQLAVLDLSKRNNLPLNSNEYEKLLHIKNTSCNNRKKVFEWTHSLSKQWASCGEKAEFEFSNDLRKTLNRVANQQLKLLDRRYDFTLSKYKIQRDSYFMSIDS
ncbi:hypothetical protein OAZ24_03720 [Synechococcus sp. AH-736-G21]|nr:hypothetical protein [Synechococcus sp. AH-736-G21]